MKAVEKKTANITEKSAEESFDNAAVLTAREREYLDCSEPTITAPEAIKGLTAGFLIGLITAAFSPGYDRGDSRIIRTSRRIKYTRYKNAVQRKLSGSPKKSDEKLLKKLNREPFLFDLESDPDEFTRKVYEEYMKNKR